METSNNLSICGLSRDNVYDAKRIVTLFQNHYGHSYPFNEVYNSDFWTSDLNAMDQSEDDIELKSIAAIEGEKLLAHIGLKFNYQSRIAELMHLALDPGSNNQFVNIGKLYWKFFSKLALKQNWRFALHYNVVSQSMLQIVSAKCFQSQEIAILPNLTQNLAKQTFSEQTAVLLSYHQTKIEDNLKVVYPWTKHQGTIEFLYNSLGLKRRIVALSDYSTTKNHYQGNTFVNQENSGSISSLGLSNIRFIEFMPTRFSKKLSQAAKYFSAAEEKLNIQGQRLCLSVTLDDPACPLACSVLENEGFRFCGILPMVFKHDYALFSKFEDHEISKLSLFTERSKILRSNLLQQPFISPEGIYAKQLPQTSAA